LLKSRLIICAALGFLFWGAPDSFAGEPANYKHAVLIRFEGEIGPSLEAYLNRKLELAHEQGADLLIVEINSMGGQLFASRDIAEHLQKLGWAHTVAYIPRDAISGAAIVALGCDEILIAPTARIGDAGPIIMGEYGIFEHAPEKIVSYVTDVLRSLAEAKGRPPAVAEAMADKHLKICRVRNLKTGKETYISQRELKDHPGEWQDLGAVARSGDDQFLALTGQNAVDFGLANAPVSSRDELARRFGLSERDLTILEPTAIDIAVEYLNWSIITAVLVIVGLTGIYMEAMAPGHGVGGALAVTCFLLVFWSHFLGGTAGWLAVLLFVGGLGGIALEVFVLPGTIVPGLAGSALVLVSLVMACQGFLIPETASQLQTLAGTLAMVVSSCGIFVAAAIVLTRRMDSLPLLNRLSLAPPEEASAEKPPGDGGERRPVVGDLGVAHTPLRPGGKGRFGEQTMDVLANGDFLDRGTPIRVVRVTGNQLLVEAVGET
jgi:membrane-bound serine protease (ClpP class)